MVVSVDTQEPVLVYKKIISQSVVGSKSIEFDFIGKRSNPKNFQALNSIIATMWDGCKRNEEDVNATRAAIESRIELLHDCRLDNECGGWYFIEASKGWQSLYNHFMDCDDHYLGSYQRAIVVGAFESGFNRNKADEFYKAGNFKAVGQAMKSQPDVLKRFTDYMIREWDIEGLLGTAFNHIDEKCHTVTLNDIKYFYFQQ